MTEPTPNAGLTDQLAALLAQFNGIGSPTGAAPSSWSRAPAATPAVESLIQGVAVPIKLNTPAGTVRVYLSLPAACAQSEDAMLTALARLVELGLPLDAYQSRDSGNGWNGNGRSNYGGNGYNRGNGNGYGRSGNGWGR